MSEQQTVETTETEASTVETEPLTLPDDHPLVRTLAEQKKAIKELKAKAQRLEELEDAQKSESDKAAERLTKAEQRAIEAEAKALRREVALDPAGDDSLPSLSKADAELLDALTDEDAMRRLAKRLATASEDKRKKTHVVSGEGKTPTVNSGDADRRAFVRQLTGRE